MSKKVALYCRVSTDNHHQTTENQLIELKKYCERQGWTIAKVYDDSGVSGSKFNRPALQDMLRDSAKGRFEVLATTSIDRLARSTIDLLNILTQLKNAGVDFVSITQAIDTTNSAGRMLMVFLGAISEWQRETIVSNVKIGINRARMQGVRLGRPKKQIDMAEVVRLRDQGISLRTIAKKIGVGNGTVYRALAAVPKSP